MTALIIIAIAATISLIIRAVRASNRRQEVAGFQSYASAASPAFPLEPGETVTLSVAARDLSAARRLENDQVADEYPGSFPLVVCTSTRLVVQMSVTDKTTDLNGSYPPRRPDLRRRIGEQFIGADRRVSSCEWPWQTVDTVLAQGDTAGLMWVSERGTAGLRLTFMSIADQNRFVTTALAAISAARARIGIVPSDATPGVDNTEYLFPGAQVICADCGTVIDAGDQFCTGCGIHVFRLENAGS
jgi:hypothetical protein